MAICIVNLDFTIRNKLAALLERDTAPMEKRSREAFKREEDHALC